MPCDDRNIPSLADPFGYAARFAPALLDPGRALPIGVAGPGGKAAKKRYDVYRNNVTVSLIDALAATYPATLRTTGAEFFRAMARFYVRAAPPASALLFEYGRDFPDFIDRYEYARSVPWLGDVARIERAWLDAYHAADAEPLAPQVLASIPAERLADTIFLPHPATRIVRSCFPAVSIFAANRGDGPAAIEAGRAEDALVTRPCLAVDVRRLPPGGAAFLSRLMTGDTFAAAAAAAAAECPQFDLAGNIVGLIEAGACTAVRHGT